jgi:MFS family permease
LGRQGRKKVSSSEPPNSGEDLANRGNRLLALLGAAHSFNHALFLIAPPLLLIIMQDLNTSKLVLGLVGTISSLIYGVGALVGGPLSDKMNEIKIVIIALALAGASTFIFIFAGNVVIYSLALFLMAAFASLYHPAATSLISKVFDRNMGEAMGIHGAGGSLGTVLAPIIAFSVGIAFGWRVSFILFGIVSIIVAILFLLNRTKTEKTQSRMSILDVFEIKGILIIMIFNVAIGLYMRGIEYFLPTYLALVPFSGLGKETAEFWAATATTLVLAAGVLGQWVGGRTSDRIGAKKVLIVSQVSVLASLLLLQFTPFWVIGVAAFILIYGVAFYGHQPALNSLTGILTPVERRGIVYGVYFFTNFGLGSFSQAIAGYFMDNYGVASSFYVFTVFSIMAVILSFMIPNERGTITREH